MMRGLMIDHLLQSTIVAALAALLTLAVRHHAGRVRYWIWMAASLKFVVPFFVLVAAGQQVATVLPVSLPAVEVSWVVETVTVPIFPGAAPTTSVPPGNAVGRRGPIGPWWLIGTMWAAGSVLMVIVWVARWRRIARVVREAVPLDSGRVHDTLRRLERFAGHRHATALVSSPTSLEPGVFGIVRPVLLWPHRLDEHLTDRQVEAILAHELVHVRHRDNLAAAAHAFVQAVFWFHPLVWWLGRRLIDERERACDETVITWGNDRQVYAESILKTCQFSIQAPAACLAAVTGSDLKKRIESIMRAPAGARLSRTTKTGLWCVGFVTVVLPVAIGVLRVPKLEARRAALLVAHPTFEIRAIRRNASADRQVQIMRDPEGRFTVTNSPLRTVIRTAYQLQDSQIAGGPDWIASDRFDIEAFTAAAPAPVPGSTGPMQSMLRQALADRFRLQMHWETRDMPLYALVVASSDGRLGERLRPATTDCDELIAARRAGGGPMPLPPVDERLTCGMRILAGHIVGGGFPLSQFANTLSMLTQRTVVDETGLEGNYDLEVEWTPNRLPQPIEPEALAKPRVNGSLFTALEEQLGLKLVERRGPVPVLVIDRIERPTLD